MTITIKDIAKVANVSTATVSRVLNGAGGYNEETKKKILKIAEELGYRRNEMARSLVKKSSNLIGIIMPNVSTIFYADIVNGIEQVAQYHGFSVILSHAGEKGNRLIDNLKMVEERKVDGLIIVSIPLNEEQIQAIESLSVPYVLLSTDTQNKRIPFIKVDDYGASYTATKYLIDQGHREIGLAGVDFTDRVAGMPRIEGYKKALRDHGLGFSTNYIQAGDYSFFSGKDALHAFHSEKVGITAVFCVSDEVALGVISAAFDLGIKIPEELSVIGYDNTRVAEMAVPPLTTIEQPFQLMGEKGCLKIIESIQQKAVVKTEMMPFRIVERASVKNRIQ
ncbi:LacI family DNA-binding transcriptional regulator [Niallia sp.]|uniref:LacI family DNA-binding transcriptional regulator n=1 Tax=Niallia sp. TaxID=2837523 RepID=UPI0028977299|nr:LacI family DNA-binding transcriptional regulator [Niallia sp.]